MRPPKAFSCLALVLASYTTSLGQSETGANPFMNDSNGRPLYLKTTYASEGSPYLFEDYLPATLTTDKGEVYKDIMVKVNLVENEVLYRLPNGKEMISTKSISKIIMPSIATLFSGTDSLMISGLTAPLNRKGTATYIICSPGQLTLLKKISITFKDTQEYGNTNTTRLFERKESFYQLDQKGNIDKLPKAPSSVLDLFANKRKAVEEYVKEHKLDLRNEKHLINVYVYYNSLF